MRAVLAFLNGAGSRGRRRPEGTDHALLALTDLLLNPGVPGKQMPVPADMDARATERARIRRPRFK